MEFEPTISAGERPQTYGLDRAVTGTGFGQNVLTLNLPAERNELICNIQYLFLLSNAKIYALKMLGEITVQ